MNAKINKENGTMVDEDAVEVEVTTIEQEDDQSKQNGGTASILETKEVP
jgi:hypothetical protein